MYISTRKVSIIVGKIITDSIFTSLAIIHCLNSNFLIYQTCLDLLFFSFWNLIFFLLQQHYIQFLGLILKLVAFFTLLEATIHSELGSKLHFRTLLTLLDPNNLPSTLVVESLGIDTFEQISSICLVVDFTYVYNYHRNKTAQY